MLITEEETRVEMPAVPRPQQNSLDVVINSESKSNSKIFLEV